MMDSKKQDILPKINILKKPPKISDLWKKAKRLSKMAKKVAKVEKKLPKIPDFEKNANVHSLIFQFQFMPIYHWICNPNFLNPPQKEPEKSFWQQTFNPILTQY